MHHVPYTHVLHSGKTVIQHIYDSHFAGAEQAALFVKQWSTLKGRIDEERFEQVLRQLDYQAGHSIVWRDAINNWFLRESSIPDANGKAGHFPNRIEAEAMDLDGYSVIEVTPWECASGGKAAEVSDPSGHGSASFRFSGRDGIYDLVVQYFDQNNGAAEFKVVAGSHQAAHWLADDQLPSSPPNGHTATCHTVKSIALRHGEVIRIEGTAQAGERACLDYVEIVPAGHNR
jgi:alpha-glucuronidase